MVRTEHRKRLRCCQGFYESGDTCVRKSVLPVSFLAASGLVPPPAVATSHLCPSCPHVSSPPPPHVLEHRALSQGCRVPLSLRVFVSSRPCLCCCVSSTRLTCRAPPHSPEWAATPHGLPAGACFASLPLHQSPSLSPWTPAQPAPPPPTDVRIAAKSGSLLKVPVLSQPRCLDNVTERGWGAWTLSFCQVLA